MKTRSRSNRAMPRRHWRAGGARVLAAVALSSITATTIACGGSGTRTTTGPSTGPDTSTLAGTWKGTVNGSFGLSVNTTKLNADSTFSTEDENPLYCKVTGKWTVAAGTYTASGRDCGNTIVTFVAPVDKLRLTGAWTASSGNSGTFTLAKQ